MRIFRSFAILSLLAFGISLSACGSSEMTPDQQKEYNDFWAASALGHQLKQGVTSGNDSNIVTEDTEKPSAQVMVQGIVKSPGYAGGPIAIELREAEACADGYCPVEGKAPLASGTIEAPGFFSLIVSTKGQKTTLSATGGGKSAMHYLGELSAKVSGVTLTLK